MAELQGAIKDIRGGKTVAEVLEESREVSHNWSEVVVIGVHKDGTVDLRRTRMSQADQALASKVLELNILQRLIDNQEPEE